jgi:hypothetical protein
MRKKVFDEPATKAVKRQIKNRPRMKVHGKSLLVAQKHGGKKLASR